MTDTILLVEDNPDDAEAIDYLRDGARAAQVRVVILDIKLPKMDGIQVLAKLKSEPRTRSIPVVILSSSNRESDIAQCYARGANGYVVKPVELEDYLDRISSVGRYWDKVNHPLPAR